MRTAKVRFALFLGIDSGSRTFEVQGEGIVRHFNFILLSASNSWSMLNAAPCIIGVS